MQLTAKENKLPIRTSTGSWIFRDPEDFHTPGIPLGIRREEVLHRKRADLIQTAHEFMAEAREVLLSASRPYVPAYSEGAVVPPEQLIRDCLANADGIVFGENHNQIDATWFMEEKMGLFADADVKTIFLEGLIFEEDQKDIDKSFKEGNAYKPIYINFENIINLAHKAGIQVKSLDCLATYKKAFDQILDEGTVVKEGQRKFDSAATDYVRERLEGMNYYAAGVISKTSGKWVALVGKNHVRADREPAGEHTGWISVPGLTDLTKSVGIEVAPQGGVSSVQWHTREKRGDFVLDPGFRSQDHAIASALDTTMEDEEIDVEGIEDADLLTEGAEPLTELMERATGYAEVPLLSPQNDEPVNYALANMDEFAMDYIDAEDTLSISPYESEEEGDPAPMVMADVQPAEPACPGPDMTVSEALAPRAGMDDLATGYPQTPIFPAFSPDRSAEEVGPTSSAIAAPQPTVLASPASEPPGIQPSAPDSRGIVSGNPRPQDAKPGASDAPDELPSIRNPDIQAAMREMFRQTINAGHEKRNRQKVQDRKVEERSARNLRTGAEEHRIRQEQRYTAERSAHQERASQQDTVLSASKAAQAQEAVRVEQVNVPASPGIAAGAEARANTTNTSALDELEAMVARMPMPSTPETPAVQRALLRRMPRAPQTPLVQRAAPRQQPGASQTPADRQNQLEARLLGLRLPDVSQYPLPKRERRENASQSRTALAEMLNDEGKPVTVFHSGRRK